MQKKQIIQKRKEILTKETEFLFWGLSEEKKAMVVKRLNILKQEHCDLCAETIDENTKIIHTYCAWILSSLISILD